MQQSERTKTTSLVAVSYSSSEWMLLRFIVFEKLHSFEKTGIDIQSIRIKVTKSSWLDLYNVYLPNTVTQHTSFDPSLIKPGPSSIFLGDLNGHSQMWDPIQPQDQRGDKILDWILNNDLHILNDGSAT